MTLLALVRGLIDRPWIVERDRPDNAAAGLAGRSRGVVVLLATRKKYGTLAKILAFVQQVVCLFVVASIK